MNDSKETGAATEPGNEDRFVVDKAYLREQVSEAVTLFFAPFSGIWRVLAGNEMRERTDHEAK